jgi:hypothetical protein
MWTEPLEYGRLSWPEVRRLSNAAMTSALAGQIEGRA